MPFLSAFAALRELVWDFASDLFSGPTVMLNYSLKRLASAIPTLLILITVAFFLIRIAPGGPIR